MTEQLGFHGNAVQYVYVGSVDEGWYFWDKQEEKPIPIPQSSLTGYLENISIEDKEYKGKTNPKLILDIVADRNYRLQAGLFTWFSKTALVRLEQLSVAQINNKITFLIRVGNENKIVFLAIKDSNNVWIKKPEDVNYSDYENEDIVFDSISKISKVLKEAKLSKSDFPPIDDEILEAETSVF